MIIHDGHCSRVFYGFCQKQYWQKVFFLKINTFNFKMKTLPKDFDFPGSVPNALGGVDKHRAHQRQPPRPDDKFHAVYSRSGSLSPFILATTGYLRMNILRNKS